MRNRKVAVFVQLSIPVYERTFNSPMSLSCFLMWITTPNLALTYMDLTQLHHVL
jgi:hypothetical protein